MPTNEERREVARKLREIKARRGLYSPWCKMVETVLDGKDCGEEDGTCDENACCDRFMKRIADLIEPERITGETSDGYHTFNELYDHRAKLFSVIVAVFPDRSWKSKRHHDGTMYDGMFIVGIDTDEGQATYHYDINPYWEIFKCKEMEYAPEWDGHTPSQAINRITKLAESIDHERTCEWVWGEEWLESSPIGPRELQWANWYLNCGCWDGYEDEFEDLCDPEEKPVGHWKYCPRCGTRIIEEK